MFRKKSVYRMAVTVIFAAVLIGYYVWEMGDGYETDFYGVDGTRKFWDSQGNLIVEYSSYAELSSSYGVKNTYLLNKDGMLLKTVWQNS